MSDLFPYQEEAVKFMRSREGALCALPTGTGKSCVGAASVRGCSPVLVISLNTMKRLWKNALIRWGGFDPDEVAVYNTGDNRTEGWWAQKGIKAYVINWQSLRFNEPLCKKKWDAILADESHALAGRTTIQSKLVRSLKSNRRYALTANPWKNSQDEIWSILNFLFPGDKRYSSYWRWLRNTFYYNEDQFHNHKITGFRDEKAFLEELDTFMVRRDKEDILDLPPKTYVDDWIDLAPRQREIYDLIKKELIAKISDTEIIAAANALAMTTRLRQIACGLHLVSSENVSSKLDRVTEVIRLLDRPVVVFSQFTGMLDEMSRRLTIDHRILHGKIKGADREQTIEDFQDGKFPLLGITTQLGGAGITLTKADTVIFLDKLWSIVMQEQGEDRIFRIGQTSSQVNIISILTNNTIEDRVEKTLEYKASLMDILNGRGNITGRDLKGLI